MNAGYRLALKWMEECVHPGFTVPGMLRDLLVEQSRAEQLDACVQQAIDDMKNEVVRLHMDIVSGGSFQWSRKGSTK
jgi:hypothetical protein